MKHAAKYLMCSVALFVHGTGAAIAADVFTPQVAEPPVFTAPEHVPSEVRGWYLRGDIGYAWSDFHGAEYYTFAGGPPLVVGSNSLSGDIDGAFTFGGGVGYQMNHYLRGDITVDWLDTDFTGSTLGSCGVAVNCVSSDYASFSALALMANVYVDFGTYGRYTPYAGFGIGGAHVDWGTLSNTSCEVGNPANCDPTIEHWGNSDWRFAYALMAGVTVDISCRLAADIGYRYRKIENGSMFSYAASTGPGFDDGITTNEIRGGLRFKFGGCAEPVKVAYEPPVYK